MEHDLFTYPHRPGHRRTDTSMAVADDMAPSARTLRAKVLAVLNFRPGGMTADDCADLLGIDKLSIRPRVSELRELGQVRDSGRRSPNASGKMAIIWVLV